jgi:hypothetical protein
LEECWLCPALVNCTLAFVLQLREKHGKTSVRVAEEIQSISKGQNNEIYEKCFSVACLAGTEGPGVRKWWMVIATPRLLYTPQKRSGNLCT